ncbi:hypothetical protein INR49_002635 [Caranx melampygus]|nr:hypothetical protein INR49_002635 [Caranx melampygus]
MDKFKTVLNIANKQTNLGFGLVALLTAGGEQVFSSAVFKCPCSELNFLYGLVFLLVPALALLLLGYILNKRTWKLLTGLCQKRAELCRCKTLRAVVVVLLQIGAVALVAPSTWIAVALLNGEYYQCLATGTNVSFTVGLCEDKKSRTPCEMQLHRLPCGKATDVLPADKDDVLLGLRAQSQILGWMLIASIMLSNLLLACLARCTSPISYLQLKFWKVYAQEENDLMDSYTTRHAKELAERNLKSFFNQKAPEPLTTPDNKDWEKISSIYKFSTKDHYYSNLHRYVETRQDLESSGMIRMGSVVSDGPEIAPVALSFIDDARIVA